MKDSQHMAAVPFHRYDFRRLVTLAPLALATARLHSYIFYMCSSPFIGHQLDMKN